MVGPICSASLAESSSKAWLCQACPLLKVFLSPTSSSVCTAHIRFNTDAKATAFNAGAIPLGILEIRVNLIVIVQYDMGYMSHPILPEKSMTTEAHACPVTLSYPQVYLNTFC